MAIIITGKNTNLGENLKEFIENNISEKLSIFFHELPDISVIVSKENHAFKTDITIHVSRNFSAHSNSNDNDPYVSVNHAIHKIITRIQKHKTKIRDKKRHNNADMHIKSTPEYVIEQQELESLNDNPVVVAEMNFDISELSVHDAIMRLELSRMPFILFSNEKTKTLNIIFERKDKNIGWIDLGEVKH